MSEVNLEPVKNREFEIRRKSPFFKTITGVVFVSIVGFSLYAIFTDLTSISWRKIVLGTIGIGLFLRYVVYQYSPFNIKTLAKTNNLKKARALKIKYDRNKYDDTTEVFDFVLHAVGQPGLVDVIYNFLGIYKCDIYDVENQRAFTS